MFGFLPFLLAAIAAVGLLVVEHLQRATASEGIASVVLCLLIAAWLIWSRRRLLLQTSILEDETVSVERVHGGATAVAVAGASGLAMALAAHLAHWPYLAWLTLLFLLGVFAYAEFGRPGVMATLPILVLLVFVNPVPSPVEPWTRLGLQSLSTTITAMMLDYFKIFFYSRGNVLGLISQKSLVPEIFSGVAWLPLTFVIVIAWGIRFHYHWLRTVLTVCLALFWVILCNGLSDAALLANKDWGGSWLDSPAAVIGWHYLTLASILFLVWSTDQFISSMMRTDAMDTPVAARASSAAADRFAPDRKMSRIDWGIAIGLLVVFGLSLRLAAFYGAGMASEVSSAASLRLPEEIESWRIEEVSPSEQLLVNQRSGSAKSWVLEKEGKKLTLDVVASDSDTPYSWRWQWFGWRNQRNTIPSDDLKLDAPATFDHLARFPGELCSVISLGSDRYATSTPLSSPLDSWFRAHLSAVANLQRALGIQSADTTQAPLPPAHTVSLSWISSQPLGQDDTTTLGQVWQKVFPLIQAQLRYSPKSD